MTAHASRLDQFNSTVLWFSYCYSVFVTTLHTHQFLSHQLIYSKEHLSGELLVIKKPKYMAGSFVCSSQVGSMADTGNKTSSSYKRTQPPTEHHLYWKMTSSEPLKGEQKEKFLGNLKWALLSPAYLKMLSMQIKEYKVSIHEHLCVFLQA